MTSDNEPRTCRQGPFYLRNFRTANLGEPIRVVRFSS